jgi:hypothetical protein
MNVLFLVAIRRDLRVDLAIKVPLLPSAAMLRRDT